MEKITDFIIDKSDLITTASSRQYTIVGEADAEFILQVFDTPSGSSDPVAFYDFATKSFSTTQVSTSNLYVKMKSNTYVNSINFPTNGSGDTYTILLLAPPNKNTELSFASGKNSYSTTIAQLANATLTFRPSSVTPLNYDSTIPETLSTASPTSTTSITEAISWSIINKKNDSYGYGLRLIRQPLDTDWFFQTTKVNVGGTAADSDRVEVADVTDLIVGMELTYITSTTIPGAATTILGININPDNSGTLMLSRDQAITSTHTMTFRAYGSSFIQEAIGTNIDFSSWNSDFDTMTLEKQFKKTVRVTGTNTVIALNNTYGISGGSHLRVKGVNVNNNGGNKVVSVSQADVDGNNGGSPGNGTITVQQTQTAALSVGTILKFFGSGLGKGSRDKLELSNTITINSYPLASRIIYLDLDKFITIGEDD